MIPKISTLTHPIISPYHLPHPHLFNISYHLPHSFRSQPHPSPSLLITSSIQPLSSSQQVVFDLDDTEDLNPYLPYHLTLSPPPPSPLQHILSTHPLLPSRAPPPSHRLVNPPPPPLTPSQQVVFDLDDTEDLNPYTPYQFNSPYQLNLSTPPLSISYQPFSSIQPPPSHSLSTGGI